MDNSKLEIENILTLSTKHIQPNTAEYLDKGYKEDKLVVYKKDEYGWFIFIDDSELYKTIKDIPEDLVAIILFALKHDCQWLCLDRDGSTTMDLPYYDW